MLAALFIFFVVVVAGLVVAAIAIYFGTSPATRFAVGLAIWLLYVGVLGYLGVIGNTSMRPPGVLLVLIPVVASLVTTALWIRTPAGTRAAFAMPTALLLGSQVFRVGVEIFLHQLWHAGVIPRVLTYSVANFDIYVGASAPLIALLATRGRGGRWAALCWNGLGLLILANVVARAILTTPGPLNFIHAELPNRMFAVFPYMFIPGFFVPLAVTLHALSIRRLLAELSTHGSETQPLPPFHGS